MATVSKLRQQVCFKPFPLTVKPRQGTLQLVLPRLRIQTLPDRPHSIHLRVVQIKRRIPGRFKLIIHYPAHGLMARWMRPGPSQGAGEIEIVGRLGEKVGDGSVAQTFAAKKRIDVSFQTARVIVKSTPAPDRRAERRCRVFRRTQIDLHVLERSVLDTATARPGRNEHGQVRSRKHGRNVVVRDRFAIAGKGGV